MNGPPLFPGLCSREEAKNELHRQMAEPPHEVAFSLQVLPVSGGSAALVGQEGDVTLLVE